LGNRVFNPGYREQFYRFATFFDLYVIPSLTEGLPMTLLEIMQSGIPVVATRVGEIPHVLKNGDLGALIEPGNKEALAEAIRHVFQHIDIYKEKTEEAKRFALKEYSAEKMSHMYDMFYHKILN
jgi:glycosyltransferase involved in cell wall biosynthesis